jgi:hypothetical protein
MLCAACKIYGKSFVKALEDNKHLFAARAAASDCAEMIHTTMLYEPQI